MRLINHLQMGWYLGILNINGGFLLNIPSVHSSKSFLATVVYAINMHCSIAFIVFYILCSV